MTTPEPLSGLVLVMLSFLRNWLIAETTLFASQCHDCQVCSRNIYKPDQRGAPSVNRVALTLQPHDAATGPKVTRIQQKFAPCLLTSVVSQSSVHARVQTIPSSTVHILKDSRYVAQGHSRLCQSVCS